MTTAQRKLKLEAFFTIVESLYQIPTLDQTEIDEMLFAYLNRVGLIQDWHGHKVSGGIIDQFFEALNRGGINYIKAAQLWEEYMEHEPLSEQEERELLREEAQIKRELLESQTAFC